MFFSFIKQKVLRRSENFGVQGGGWVFILLAMILLALSVLYFGSESGLESSSAVTANGNQTTLQRPPRLYVVFYDGGVFSPTNLRIRKGDTVKFANESRELLRIISGPHPEHNGLLDFDSRADIASPGIFSYTFKISGIFPYHNEHNLNESGTIIVR